MDEECENQAVGFKNVCIADAEHFEQSADECPEEEIEMH